ncbi:hypothetical protein FRC17_007122, partial [Serendipita sp. 399]
MTGGGTGRCIQTTESRGLGEGWSDAFAEWMSHKDASVPDFTMARWVNNSPKGYRTYPYSTDRAVNPLKYSNLTSLNAVHAIGENIWQQVWANMLHNVYAGLVEQSCSFIPAVDGQRIPLRIQTAPAEMSSSSGTLWMGSSFNPAIPPLFKLVMLGSKRTSIATMECTDAQSGKPSHRAGLELTQLAMLMISACQKT